MHCTVLLGQNKGYTLTTIFLLRPTPKTGYSLTTDCTANLYLFVNVYNYPSLMPARIYKHADGSKYEGQWVEPWATPLLATARLPGRDGALRTPGGAFKGSCKRTLYAHMEVLVKLPGGYSNILTSIFWFS